MTTQQPVEQSSGSSLDSLLLLLSFGAIAGGIFSFYYLENELGQTVRVLIVLGSLAASLALAYQTQIGKVMVTYIRGSNIELRKTTWPTRQESLQATLMIAVVVMIVALLLWGLDSALLYGVKSVTGRG